MSDFENCRCEMKNVVCFIASMVITILLLTVVRFLLDNASGLKLKYELNTYVSIENNGEKILQGSNILYSACANKDGNIELTFKVGKYDERKVKFELSIMKDFKQTPFLSMIQKQKS